MELLHNLPAVKVVDGRHPFIAHFCTGKNVLNVGCVDAPQLEQRFASGQLLHPKLDRVASELYGVDVDKEGIEFLRSKGFTRLFCVDLTADPLPEVLVRAQFDVIVLGEVIEHVINPGLMLDAIRSLMQEGKTKLIVTVPNAFRIDAIWALLGGREWNHPDHNYWFSHLTISNLIKKCGLAIEAEYVYMFHPSWHFPRRRREVLRFDARQEDREPGFMQSIKRLWWRIHATPSELPRRISEFPRRLLASLLYSRSPFWGDGIILICGR